MLFMYEITDRGKKEAEETKKVNSYFSLHAELATFRGSFIKWRPHICPHVLKVLLSPILRRPAVIFKCVRFAQPFTADHNLMVKGKKNKQTNKKQDAFTNVSALCTDWKKKKSPALQKTQRRRIIGASLHCTGEEMKRVWRGKHWRGGWGRVFHVVNDVILAERLTVQHMDTAQPAHNTAI